MKKRIRKRKLACYCRLLYFFSFSILAAWKVIRGWLPAEADQFIKFVDAKSITQYVRTDQLSTAMGGTVSWKEIDLIRTIDKTTFSILVFSPSSSSFSRRCNLTCLCLDSSFPSDGFFFFNDFIVFISVLWYLFSKRYYRKKEEGEEESLFIGKSEVFLACVVDILINVFMSIHTCEEHC